MKKSSAKKAKTKTADRVGEAHANIVSDAASNAVVTNNGAGDPLPSQAAKPAEPPAQPGDKPVEVAKAVAVPVHQSLEQGKKELDAHPARASTLTSEGHLVREQ